MPIDFPTLNNALFGSSGGGGVITDVANAINTRRALDQQALQHADVLSANREMAERDDAYRNRALTEESRRFDEQEKRLRQQFGDELANKLAITRETQVANRTRAKSEALLNEAKAKNQNVEIAQKEYALSLKKEEEVRKKWIGPAKDAMARMQEVYNTGDEASAAAYLKSPEGMVDISIMSASPELQKLLGTQTYLKEGASFQPLQTQDGLFQIFSIDKEGDQVPITVDRISIKEGGTPITVPASQLMEFLRGNVSSLVSPGEQYKQSKLEGNIDAKRRIDEAKRAGQVPSSADIASTAMYNANPANKGLVDEVSGKAGLDRANEIIAAQTQNITSREVLGDAKSSLKSQKEKFLTSIGKDWYERLHNKYGKGVVRDFLGLTPLGETLPNQASGFETIAKKLISDMQNSDKNPAPRDLTQWSQYHFDEFNKQLDTLIAEKVEGYPETTAGKFKRVLESLNFYPSMSGRSFLD